MLVVRKFYGPVGQPGYETNSASCSTWRPRRSRPTDPADDVDQPGRSTTRTPKRMADAAEACSSLGWPGLDDKVRREVKDQVEGPGEVAPRRRPGRRGRRPPGQPARLRGPRPLHQADLGRRGRPRPHRRRALRRHHGLPEPPERLRRGDPQERLRDPPRGGLRLPPRLRRRLHDPGRDDLQRRGQARHRGDPGGHHPRGDAPRRQGRRTGSTSPKPTPIVVKLTGGRRKMVLPYIAAAGAGRPSPTKPKAQARPGPAPEARRPPAPGPGRRPAGSRRGRPEGRGSRGPAGRGSVRA